jgi:zinc resistance-associated protein
MWKTLLVLSTTLALAGSAALAQQRPDGRDDVSYRFQRPSLDDLGAFTDARVAGLKAGLRLTPEQDKNWPAFEQAYRNLAKLRSDRMAAADSRTSGANDQNMVDRLQRRAETISQYGAALTDLAKAAKPLYASLDDAQKRRFATLSRFMAPHRHFAMGSDRMGSDRMGPHGMGMMGSHGMMGPQGMGERGGPGFGAGRHGRDGDTDE